MSSSTNTSSSRHFNVPDVVKAKTQWWFHKNVVLPEADKRHAQGMKVDISRPGPNQVTFEFDTIEKANFGDKDMVPNAPDNIDHHVFIFRGDRTRNQQAIAFMKELGITNTSTLLRALFVPKYREVIAYYPLRPARMTEWFNNLLIAVKFKFIIDVREVEKMIRDQELLERAVSVPPPPPLPITNQDRTNRSSGNPHATLWIDPKKKPALLAAAASPAALAAVENNNNNNEIHEDAAGDTVNNDNNNNVSSIEGVAAATTSSALEESSLNNNNNDDQDAASENPNNNNNDVAESDDTKYEDLLSQFSPSLKQDIEATFHGDDEKQFAKTAMGMMLKCSLKSLGDIESFNIKNKGSANELWLSKFIKTINRRVYNHGEDAAVETRTRSPSIQTIAPSVDNRARKSTSLERLMAQLSDETQDQLPPGPNYDIKLRRRAPSEPGPRVVVDLTKSLDPDRALSPEPIEKPTFSASEERMIEEGLESIEEAAKCRFEEKIVRHEQQEYGSDTDDSSNEEPSDADTIHTDSERSSESSSSNSSFVTSESSSSDSNCGFIMASRYKNVAKKNARSIKKKRNNNKNEDAAASTDNDEANKNPPLTNPKEIYVNNNNDNNSNTNNNNLKANNDDDEEDDDHELAAPPASDNNNNENDHDDDYYPDDDDDDDDYYAQIERQGGEYYDNRVDYNDRYYESNRYDHDSWEEEQNEPAKFRAKSTSPAPQGFATPAPQQQVPQRFRRPFFNNAEYYRRINATPAPPSSPSSPVRRSNGNLQFFHSSPNRGENKTNRNASAEGIITSTNPADNHERVFVAASKSPTRHREDGVVSVSEVVPLPNFEGL